MHKKFHDLHESCCQQIMTLTLIFGFSDIYCKYSVYHPAQVYKLQDYPQISEEKIVNAHNKLNCVVKKRECMRKLISRILFNLLELTTN